MAVGQRVKVEKRNVISHRMTFDGQGTVVAFLVSQTETAGIIDRIVSAVVETDDGRFLDCSLAEIQRVEEPISEEAKRVLAEIKADLGDEWLAQVDADPLYGQTESKGAGVNNAGGPNGTAGR